MNQSPRPDAVPEKTREVDWEEWSELLLSRRRLERPWSPRSVRPRVYDPETGQVFVLREHDWLEVSQG